MIAPRCAGSPCRRRLKRGAAKLATLRCAQTDAAPYPLQAPPSRRAQRDFPATSKTTATSKATATATATATAAAPPHAAGKKNRQPQHGHRQVCLKAAGEPTTKRFYSDDSLN